MKVRPQKFDFSQTPVHWSSNPEFSQRFNGSSILIPHLERFLNRVIAKANACIKSTDEQSKDLKRDIAIFIRQEATHYGAHQEHGDALKAAGYNFEEFETYFSEEYEKLFSTKSLAFLCAYCEGFETLGPIAAKMWLDDELGELTTKADSQVIALWKWHFVEEFEHRTVCFDVFNAVHGGYFLRIYGFIYQIWHFKRMIKRITTYLLECDRKSMTPAERVASMRREKAAAKTVNKAITAKLWKVFSPAYNPRNAQEPINFQSYRAKLDKISR